MSTLEVALARAGRAGRGVRPLVAVAGARWAGPLAALLAAVAIGYKPVWTLVPGHAPWVLNIYQNVALGAGDLALAALAALGWLAWRGRPAAAPPGWRITVAAGVLLLACLAASATAAGAPLLTAARCAAVAAGLAAYAAIARRPALGRWLLAGCGALLLVELPLVALQIATQSTFPTGTLLDRWPREMTAAMSGAAVVIGPHGLRWQRALGSFPHPNVLGGFAALTLVLLLPRLARPGRARAALLALWGVAWVEVVFSFSRAALLAAALGCGLWALGRARGGGHRRDVALLALPPAAAVLAGLVVSGPALLARLALPGGALTLPSIAGRLLIARVAFDLIRLHPLLGVGAGNFPLAELAPPFNAVSVEPVHVVPLLVAAEAGIPAGLAWLALVLAQPLAEWRRRARRGVVPGRLAFPVALLTLALLDHYLWTFAPGRALCWITLGIWAGGMSNVECRTTNIERRPIAGN
ncbi:MAG TPA: O-antigen ligase family protein [Thermomicrobiales bacterium]|nr:O-antigen ligase family protein [Thermomicrobiales bacterium]